MYMIWCYFSGAITQDTVEVYAISDVDSIQLPEEGAWVAVEITVVYNPAHFYVVFPFGSKPLKDIMKEDASTDGKCVFVSLSIPG